jgi:preprotein translocase subunit YajC
MLLAVHMFSASHLMLAAKAAKKGGSSGIWLLLLLVVYGAVFYFYLRPRSKRQKAARLEAKKVDVGERVRTIGGFVGVITKIEDGLTTVRGANGVELDFIASAIAGRFDPTPVPEPEPDEAEHHEEGDAK